MDFLRNYSILLILAGIASLVVSYYIIKTAVKNGVIEALTAFHNPSNKPPSL